jgi:hypothetical protein
VSKVRILSLSSIILIATAASQLEAAFCFTHPCDGTLLHERDLALHVSGFTRSFEAGLKLPRGNCVMAKIRGTIARRKSSPACVFFLPMNSGDRSPEAFRLRL